MILDQWPEIQNDDNFLNTIIELQMVTLLFKSIYNLFIMCVKLNIFCCRFLYCRLHIQTEWSSARITRGAVKLPADLQQQQQQAAAAATTTPTQIAATTCDTSKFRIISSINIARKYRRRKRRRSRWWRRRWQS